MSYIIYFITIPIILISIISSLVRMDYNLPLFIFFLIIWKKLIQLRIFCFYLILFSWLIDIVYISFWERIIKLKEIQNFDKENIPKLFMFYLFINIINIITIFLKLCLILLLLIRDRQVRTSFNIRTMKNKLINLFLFN